MITIAVLLVIYTLIICGAQVDRTITLRKELDRLEFETLLLEIELDLIGVENSSQETKQTTEALITVILMTDEERIDNFVTSVKEAFAVEPEVEEVKEVKEVEVSHKNTLRTLIQEAVLEAPVTKVVSYKDPEFKGVLSRLTKLTKPQCEKILGAKSKLGVTKLRLEVRAKFEASSTEVYNKLKELNLI